MFIFTLSVFDDDIATAEKKRKRQQVKARNTDQRAWSSTTVAAVNIYAQQKTALQRRMLSFYAVLIGVLSGVAQCPYTPIRESEEG